MTSTVRYYSFKDVPWTRRQPSLAIVLLCLFVAVVWKYSEVVLTLFASAYVVAGLALQIVRALRHRVTSSRIA
jgi:phosphatidylserine synthase